MTVLDPSYIHTRTHARLHHTGGGQHITDVTNASRTLLMDIATLQWDEATLQTLGIPVAMLPEIRSSSEVYGTGFGVLEGVRLAGQQCGLHASVRVVGIG